MIEVPYPKKYLNNGEDVLVDLHPHWVSIAVPTAVAGLMACVLLYANVKDWPDWARLMLLVMTLLPAGWAGVKWLGRMTTYFVVTTDRVIYRAGLLTRSGVEIPLEKVNNVNFRQTLSERLIKAGDLLIESGGQDGTQKFSDIPNPSEVQNQIAVAIEENDRSTYGGMPTGQTRGDDSPTAGSVQTQVKKLHYLDDEGVLSH